MRNKAGKEGMGPKNHMTETHKGKNPELSPFHGSGKEHASDRTGPKTITPPAPEYPKR